MKTSSLHQIPDEAVAHNPRIRKRVMLRKGDVPHLANFTQSRFPPGATVEPHAHDGMHEVFFVESGRALVRVNGEDVQATAGTCIAVKPGESHEVINVGDEELVLTYFGILEA